MKFYLLDIIFERPVNKLINKLHDWLDFIVLKTPNIVLGIIVLLLFVLLSKILSRAIEKLADKFTDWTNLKFLLIKTVRISLQVLGFVVALNVIGLDKTVTSLLAGAGIIGLALSFAFQNIATNFISGILISVRHSYEVGDWIMSQGIEGIVDEITIYHTVVVTDTGQFVTIPNKEILESPLFNFTKNGSREVELRIGISYKDDLDHVLQVTEEALLNVPSLLKDKKHRLYFKEFSDFSIQLEVNFWILFKKQRDYDLAVSDTIRLIKKAYDKNGIVIPFPIRTVELEDSRSK